MYELRATQFAYLSLQFHVIHYRLCFRLQALTLSE